MLKVSLRPKSLTWACSAGIGARSQVARTAVMRMESPPAGGSVEAEGAPEDGLRVEAHAEARLDARPHAAGESGDVAGSRAVVADDGERVARREADRAF